MAPNVVRGVAFKNILSQPTSPKCRSMPCCMHWRWPSALTPSSRWSMSRHRRRRLPFPMEPVPVALDWQKKRGAQGLARLEGFEGLHMFRHDMVLKQGSPWPEIRDLIEQRGIDLIVLGTHGRGLIGTLLLGSTAEQVCCAMPHAQCLRLGQLCSPASWIMSGSRMFCLQLIFPMARCTLSPTRCRWRRRTMPHSRC